ncbi:MAG: multidrug ABC transporter permease [Ignavibacteria bacterium GWA2_55_11]|nr:MAG: multidrug ABC transporter permease [Ignavibacteria bacterium GWA2_55_11]OGU43771.1 MAG: multidrug ABC transporter permease [Ignavibacteria bacterium GWC2_56_12]OGU66564.1 MAG: multidrug ABC transporter permease [Ignavibacteria bacterium RIFCSPHIGHO2_02_FULL_56_12]HAV23631.1 multidrug ABC transporter permease [Bacteroidota bacterium]
MKIPFSYILRNLGTRRLTTGITVIGVALVAFVYAAVLMMARGVQETLVATGSADNAIVVRKSSQGEISSIIDGETANVIKSLPHIAKASDGGPVVSGEPVVVINLDKVGGGLSNVIVRGVSPHALTMRPQLKIVSGRMFNFGAREVIAGTSISSKFHGASVGDKVRFAGDDWSVVGLFEAGKGGFESEMWGDALQLLSAFNRGSSVSSLTLKLEGAEKFEDFKRAFESEQRLNQFETKPEQKYFEEQSEAMATFIRIFGIFITVFFSLGSTIGAMITMYAAVANRTVEVGTLRALGFRRRSVLTAFLVESLVLAFIGGIIGLGIASFLQFFQISTLNFASFAELAFSFALTPEIVVNTLLFALGMGFVGGFLPSVRAARLNIVNALRAA